MFSVCDIKVPRERDDPMLSNGSRDTLMSHTEHSMQRRLKSNAHIVMISAQETFLIIINVEKCCAAQYFFVENVIPFSLG